MSLRWIDNLDIQERDHESGRTRHYHLRKEPSVHEHHHSRDRTGTELAQGEQGAEVVGYEGNLYFAPDGGESGGPPGHRADLYMSLQGNVQLGRFRRARTAGGQRRGLGLPQAKPGHEVIQGRFGFYAGRRGSTRQEWA